MARPGGADRPQAAGSAARRRAVGVAAVARPADGERPAALTAGPLAERLIHGVGARKAISDWTTSRSRGTKGPAVSVCRSSGRSRGSGGQDRTLTLRPGPLGQLHTLFGRGRRDVRTGARRTSGCRSVRGGLAPAFAPLHGRHAHLAVPGEGSPGQSPNTACGNSQGPACSLLDGGLLFSGRPGVTEAAKRCLASPS